MNGRSVATRRLLPVVLGALLLGGCAAPASDLSAEAATELQAAVLEVAQAAEQGRFDAASEAAEQVRSALEAAALAGDISVARYALIDDALRRTVEEIEAADAAAEAAAADAAAAEKAAKEAEEAAATEVATEPSAGNGSGPAAPKDDPKGKGAKEPKGKGKGKGNG